MRPYFKVKIEVRESVSIELKHFYSKKSSSAHYSVYETSIIVGAFYEAILVIPWTFSGTKFDIPVLG